MASSGSSGVSACSWRRSSARISQLDRLGTIESGKAADLVVLNANPLEDIRNTREIDSVWIEGRQLGTGAGTN